MNENYHDTIIHNTPSSSKEPSAPDRSDHKNFSENVTDSLSDIPALEQLLMKFRESKLSMSYIKPEMLPDIDLYMDQVTTFMDTHLSESKRYADDKILTKTMINNYAKNNLLPSPDKKKYSKDHLLLLTFIYYLKSILSMNDIQSLLGPIKDQFFHNTEHGLRLEDIYSEVFRYEKEIQGSIMDDIMKKYEQSRESFLTQNNTEDRQMTLQNFTFMCMLCYDIFIKKQLVEQIIDKLYTSDKSDSKKRK